MESRGYRKCVSEYVSVIFCVRTWKKPVERGYSVKIVGADSKKDMEVYMGKLWGKKTRRRYVNCFISEYPDGTFDYREYLFPGVPQMLRTLKMKIICWHFGVFF